jgi:hypothetical protein
MRTYILGEQAELLASFTDATLAPADPSDGDVHCRVLEPDGNEANLDTSIENIGFAERRVLYTVAKKGLHHFRFYSESSLTAAGESYFLGQSVFPEGDA